MKYTKDNIYNEFVGKNNKLVAPHLKWKYIKENKELYDFMINYFPDITEDNITPIELLYRIVNNITEIPTCKVCGKKLEFKRWSRGYGDFCCIKCRRSDEGNKIVNLSIENTIYKHYGVYHPAQNKDIKEKIFKTNLQKYGVKMPGQLNECKEKYKQTCLQKYGYEYASQSNIVKEKVKYTCIQKYGSECSLSSLIIKEQIKKTNLQKYGAENVFASKIIQDKIKEVNYKKYGNSIYALSDDMKNKQKVYIQSLTPEIIQEMIQKRKQTCIEKYGVETNLLLPEIIEYNKIPERIQHIWDTKKKNKTTNTSKIEKEFYYYLIGKYGISNVEQNYNKDSRYPYFCDFYIKPLDLFIEIQGHQSHGPHPFNENNELDLLLLNKWLSKVSDKHPQYELYIHNWTIRDTEKRNTAIKNNIKFLEIFTTKIIDVINYFEQYLNENNKYMYFSKDK